MDPGNLSYSKISTYIGCPFEYFLKYGLGVESKDNPYLAFGKLIHEMLDKFWDVNYQSPDSFAGQFVGIWYKLVNHEMKGHREIQFQYPEQSKYMATRGRKMLQRFYLDNIGRKEEGDVPLLREYEFKIEITNKSIVGVFDRVDNPRNGATLRKIMDYKTDSHPPKDIDEANFVQSFQFTLYRIAHNMLFNQDAIVHAHYLQNGRIFPIKYHERPEEFVIKQIEHVWNHILRNKFGQHISYRCKDNCQFFLPVCKKIGEINPRGKLEKLIEEGEIKCSQQKWEDYKSSKVQGELFPGMDFRQRREKQEPEKIPFIPEIIEEDPPKKSKNKSKQLRLKF